MEHIVKRKPEKSVYALQPPYRHCGMYTLKAILSWFGKDTKSKQTDYYETPFGRMLWFTLPERMIEKLSDYELSVEEWRLKNFSKAEKINFLKQSITEDKPIILLVANGHTRAGKFILLKSIFCMHRLSIRGYDDEEQVFFVYDSTLHPKKYDHTIPIWNRKMSYDVLIRQRRLFSIYGFYKNFYIKVWEIK